MAAVGWSKIALFVLLALVVTATVGQSDRTDKVYRIGFLAFGSRPVSTAVKSPLVAFRQTLRRQSNHLW